MDQLLPRHQPKKEKKPKPPQKSGRSARTKRGPSGGFQNYDRYYPVTAHYRTVHINGAVLADFDYVRNHVDRMIEKYSMNGDRKVYHTFGYQKIQQRFWNGDITSDQGLYKITWSGGIVADSNFTMDGHKLEHRQWFDFDASVYNIALQRYFDQLRNSELQLSVDLIEMMKTRDMMMLRARQLVNLARRARRAAIPRYRSRRQRRPSEREDDTWAHVMGKTWLEWKYGWSPLLGSIYEGCKFQREKANRFRVEGKYSKKVRFGYQDDIQVYPGLTATGLFRGVYACRIRGDYGVRDRAYFNASRLSPLNPATIAWELIPYSFVIDWFVDIGGYLQNMETAYGAGLNFLQGYETQLYVARAKATIRAGQVVNNGFTEWSTSGGLNSSYYRVRRRRFRLTEPPIPRIPSFNPKLGWQRMLSAAALLVPILKVKPSSYDDRGFIKPRK